MGTPVPPAPAVPPPHAPVGFTPASTMVLPIHAVELPAPFVVQSTDPVLDHALCLVGFDRHHNPDHPVFQCLAQGGYDTFYHLFYLNSQVVRDLSYFNTSVNPPTWTSLN